MDTIELSRVDGCRYLIFVDGWCTGWMLSNAMGVTEVYKWVDGVKTVGYSGAVVSFARGVPSDIERAVIEIIGGV